MERSVTLAGCRQSLRRLSDRTLPTGCRGPELVGFWAGPQRPQPLVLGIATRQVSANNPIVVGGGTRSASTHSFVEASWCDSAGTEDGGDEVVRADLLAPVVRRCDLDVHRVLSGPLGMAMGPRPGDIPRRRSQPLRRFRSVPRRVYEQPTPLHVPTVRTAPAEPAVARDYGNPR